MAVLLGILKWIGILLLIVIGLIFLLAVTVLCVPVRWHILAARDETWRGRGQITWLLHFLSLTWIVVQGRPELTVRICGWKWRSASASRKKKNKKAARSTKKSRQAKRKQKESETERNDAKAAGGLSREQKPEAAQTTGSGKSGQQTAEKRPSSEKTTGGSGKAEQASAQKHSWMDSVRKRLSFGQRFSKINREKYWNDKTKAVLRISLEALRDLWKHLHIGKLKGWVHFGTSDPCMTGEILGLLAVFYPVIGDKVQIRPEFEEAVLETELEWQGHIRLLFVLKAVLHVLLSPQWRELQSK